MMVFAFFAATLLVFSPWLIALSYFVGQFAHFVMKAVVLIQSKSPINSVSEYWNKYWPLLLNRFLWATCLFILVAILPAVLFPQWDFSVKIENLPPVSALLFKCALCCMVGLATDSFLDKCQGAVKDKTGIDLSRDVPQIPDDKTKSAGAGSS